MVDHFIIGKKVAKMNKNELQFLKGRVINLKSKLEIAANCINSAINDLDESDDFIKLIDFYYKKAKQP